MISGKKVAGILPGVISTGAKIKTVKVGIGINVNNKAPMKAISLSEVMDTFCFCQNYWASKALISIDRAFKLMEDFPYLEQKFKYFLLSDFLKDSRTGENWKIIGIDRSGGLIIENAKETKTLIRNF